MRRRLAVLAVFVLALAFPAGAVAAPEQEPNDGIHQANGGGATGTVYTGAISSSGDVDTYIVYVSGQGVLNISTTNTIDASHCDIDTLLRDGDGGYLNSISTDENTTSAIPYNTPGANVYFITVDGVCPVNTYQFKVTGPVIGGPRPGPAIPTTNGHADITSALGPLAGGALYGASIDAYNEQDWFFFYTAGAGAFDIATTNTIDSCSGSIDVDLQDGGGRYLNSTYVSEDRARHILYTAAGPAKFVLQFRGRCPVNTYQFHIAPAGLLTATPPAPPVTPAAPAPAPVAPKQTLKQCLAAAKKLKGKARKRASRACRKACRSEAKAIKGKKARKRAVRRCGGAKKKHRKRK